MERLDLSDAQQCAQYEEFVNTHPMGSFTQSLGWRGVKNNWESQVLVHRDEEGRIAASLLVLIKRLPLLGRTLLYAPRGPVGNLHDIDVLREMLAGIKELAREYRAYLFKMDPYVLADDWAFIDAAMQLGFTFHPQSPELVNTIQTRVNYMLDIRDKTEEELFDSFHSKWRYNIRLAQRRGVECKVCGKEALDDFYGLMEETGRRDGFRIRSREYFVRMMDSLGEHCRLYLCYYKGIPLSGAIATQFGGRTCYVYGASTSKFRSMMPNYLMQWSMIRWALEGRCRIYDFQGIPHYQEPEHPNYGVYRFKSGFHGQVVEFAGEFDYVFHPGCKALVDCVLGAVRLPGRIKEALCLPKHRVLPEKKQEQPASERAVSH